MSKFFGTWTKCWWGRQSWAGKWGEWQHSHNSLEKAEQVRILEITCFDWYTKVWSSFSKEHNKQVNSPIAVKEKADPHDYFCGLNFEVFKPLANFVLFWPANVFCLVLRNNYWEYSEHNTNHATSLQKYSESKTMTHSIWQFFWSNCSSLLIPINLTIFLVKLFKFILTYQFDNFFRQIVQVCFDPFNLTIFFIKLFKFVLTN